MAIFQLKVDKISKQKNSKGASRSNDYIQRENEFEGKDDLIYKEDKNIPEEFKDGKEFTEIMEKNIRKNARLFKKYEQSLPREFSDEKNIEIAKEFCEKQFGDKYIYFLAVHNPDGDHAHMHINVFERKIDGIKRENKETYFKRPNTKNREKGGWYADRECNKKKYTEELYKNWEDHLNNHLVEAGLPKLKPKPKEKNVKKEKEKFYSVKEIKEMDTKKLTELLLTYESQIKDREEKRDNLYKKKNSPKKQQERIVNELTDNSLYKLDNQIKSLKVKMNRKNISSKEKISTFQVVKSLEKKREEILKDNIGTDQFKLVEKEIGHRDNRELKKLNKEIENIRKRAEKVINNRSKDEMREVSHKLLKKKIYLSKLNIDKKGKYLLKSATKSKYAEKRNSKKDFMKVKRNLLVAINLGSRIFRIVGVGKTQPDDSYGKLIDLRISKLNKGRESEKTIYDNTQDEKDLSDSKEEVKEGELEKGKVRENDYER